jgi:hypothetical protein
MAGAFKADDTVQLQSVRPRMTLTSVDDRGYVRMLGLATRRKSTVISASMH